VESLGETYTELETRRASIQSLLAQEESMFAANLERGLGLLEKQLQGLAPGDSLNPSVVYELHDTYGFPMDLTTQVCTTRGFKVDTQAVQIHVEEGKATARASWQGSGEAGSSSLVSSWMQKELHPEFTGYQRHPKEEGATVMAFTADMGGEEASEAGEARVGWVSIDPCPFYGEAGGQVGDRGCLLTGDGTELRVLDTVRPYEGGIALKVAFPPTYTLQEGEKVMAVVDLGHRRNVECHHTATHLLHAALRDTLGDGILQAGSLVDAERLRFDFTHDKGLKPKEIARLEQRVNASIALEKEVPSPFPLVPSQRRMLCLTLPSLPFSLAPGVDL